MFWPDTGLVLAKLKDSAEKTGMTERVDCIQVDGNTASVRDLICPIEKDKWRKLIALFFLLYCYL